MRNRKQLAGLFLFPAVAAALIIYIMLNEPAEGGITRAMAARAVVFAVSSEEEYESWRGENWASHFPADIQEEWYVGYMDYLYTKGYFSDGQIPATRASAEGSLTWEDARGIAEAVDENLAKRVHVTSKNREEPMPETTWWRFYDRLLETVGAEEAVTQVGLILLGTPANVADAPAWTAYTDQGEWRFDGLSLDSYMNQKLAVLVRDRQILRLISVSPDVSFSNVWILSGAEDHLTVLIGDNRWEIPFGRMVSNAETLASNLADLTLSGGQIRKVSLKKERITGEILSIRENALEVEGYGVLKLAEGCLFLRTYGDPRRLSLSDLTVGAQNQEFVVADGEIAAVLMARAEGEPLIRVLITTTGFKNIFHDQITLSSDAPLMLTQREEEEKVDAGSALVVVKDDARLSSGRLIITPAEGHEITVSSIDRTDGKPRYGGRLEIVEAEDGLVLINELRFEDYLKKVVPSEMPGSFEPEALKAQAVCARTYAYTQMKSNRYREYGAQLDDSTSFQVYNNSETAASTSQAVEDTYGKVITCQGEPISAYYFSTSCGNTTDGSVWEMDPEDAPYLKSISLTASRKTYDWSSEEEFSSYIKRSNVKAYDSGSAYFRWSLTTTADRLSETFGDVGTVTALRITKRGAGGVALEMLVRGTDGELTVAGQNSIRAALCDPSLELTRNDGKTVSGFAMLPSAFLTVEPNGRTEDGVQKFTIYGGGNGHGAGMSQNGAQGMAKEGKTWQEILKFFYEGIEISDCYTQAQETSAVPAGTAAENTAQDKNGAQTQDEPAGSTEDSSAAEPESAGNGVLVTAPDRAEISSGGRQ